MTNDFTVQAAMPSGSGIAALRAVPQGAGIGLPASWCTGTAGFGLRRLADLGQKPGTTTIRTNYNHMTRVIANSEGGSGSQPLREHPPA